MSIGKRMLVFSAADPDANQLMSMTTEWGCLVTKCNSEEEMRGKIEGTDFDYALVEGVSVLRKMIGEADPEGDLLALPLAEIEKRHILRVLASTGGNKTRAAKILGIDTKTLYNKLKAYEAANEAARRRKPDNNAIAG